MCALAEDTETPSISEASKRNLISLPALRLDHLIQEGKPRVVVVNLAPGREDPEL